MSLNTVTLSLIVIELLADSLQARVLLFLCEDNWEELSAVSFNVFMVLILIMIT